MLKLYVQLKKTKKTKCYFLIVVVNRCFMSKYESPALCVVVFCTVSCAIHYFSGEKRKFAIMGFRALIKKPGPDYDIYNKTF